MDIRATPAARRSPPSYSSRDFPTRGRGGCLAARRRRWDRASGRGLRAVLGDLRQNAARLGIDENSIGAWACSGNVPNALSLLMEEGGADVRCAVLCYGYMLDLDGSERVANAARMSREISRCLSRERVAIRCLD